MSIVRVYLARNQDNKPTSKRKRITLPALVDKEVDDVNGVQNGDNDHGVGHIPELLVLECSIR